MSETVHCNPPNQNMFTILWYNIPIQSPFKCNTFYKDILTIDRGKCLRQKDSFTILSIINTVGKRFSYHLVTRHTFITLVYLATGRWSNYFSLSSQCNILLSISIQTSSKRVKLHPLIPCKNSRKIIYYITTET